MTKRTDLQNLLETVLGSKKVYFQPPATVKMSYPCIVYEHSYGATKFADNLPYNVAKRYQVTLIDKNPDSPIHDKIAALPTCIFDRRFTQDNLNHEIFSMYY